MSNIIVYLVSKTTYAFAPLRIIKFLTIQTSKRSIVPEDTFSLTDLMKLSIAKQRLESMRLFHPEENARKRRTRFNEFPRIDNGLGGQSFNREAIKCLARLYT